MSTRLAGALYKRVFDGGRTVRGRLFNAWALELAGSERKAGVVVSKRSFHDAVDRNRAKRILREGFRLAAGELPEGMAWVLVGRAALGGAKTADVTAELLRFGSRISG